MDSYIGVKILKSAELMTVDKYNSIRGWVTPSGEDKEKEVYLVEYEPSVDNESNLDGYEGYVSMSPKDIFESSYSKLVLGVNHYNFALYHELRVQEEAEALFGKMYSLQVFVDNDELMSDLTEESRGLLRKQLLSMKSYLSILNNRMAGFKDVPEEEASAIPMNFGEAVDALRSGSGVSRPSYLREDVYLYMEMGAITNPDGSVSASPIIMLAPMDDDEDWDFPEIDITSEDILAEDWLIVA